MLHEISEGLSRDLNNFFNRSSNWLEGIRQLEDAKAALGKSLAESNDLVASLRKQLDDETHLREVRWLAGVEEGKQKRNQEERLRAMIAKYRKSGFEYFNTRQLLDEIEKALVPPPANNVEDVLQKWKSDTYPYTTQEVKQLIGEIEAAMGPHPPYHADTVGSRIGLVLHDWETSAYSSGEAAKLIHELIEQIRNALAKDYVPYGKIR